MNRLPMLLLCSLVSLSLAGCHNDIVYTAADTTVLTPKPRAYDIQVVYGTPERPHRVLGEVRVTRRITAEFGQSGSYDQAVEEMKRYARRVGGDAVMSLKAIDSQHGGSEGRLTLTGQVIVFKGPAGTAEAAR